MAEGRTGPPEMTVSMLKEAMDRKSEECSGHEVGQGDGEGRKMVFLIDGEDFFLSFSCLLNDWKFLFFKADMEAGFPRSVDRIALFESTICSPSLVLSLECPLQILQERLLVRSKLSSRIDDGVAIMQKRFDQHLRATKPVIAHYDERGLVVEIDGSRSVEVVHEDIFVAAKKVLRG